MGILLGAAIGLALGVGGYTFIYAKGISYLTDDPAACVNCHIMRKQYDGWIRSSHRAVAACNDCHTPAGYLSKYATKASNGFWHSFAFTSGRFAEPIRIKRTTREITETHAADAISPSWTSLKRLIMAARGYRAFAVIVRLGIPDDGPGPTHSPS